MITTSRDRSGISAVVVAATRSHRRQPQHPPETLTRLATDPDVRTRRAATQEPEHTMTGTKPASARRKGYHNGRVS